MSKKQKKIRKLSSKKKQTPTLNIDAQEKQTYSLLENKKYKNAIESCKILLKHDKRPEWYELLAEIYHGRSRELADKGLYKEAVIIYRNRADICNQPLADIFYFNMLLAAGMNERALLLYQQYQTHFEQQHVLPEVRQQLAALSLTLESHFLKKLPPDDILIKDYPIAMDALQAYCNADDETLIQQLANISFRSPFRDLRQVLKALSFSENNVAAKIKLLESIPTHSPFKHLAQTINTASLPINQIFADFSKLTPGFIQFIATTKNIPQLPLLFNELHLLKEKSTGDALMRLILRHQKMLSKDYIKHAALRILLDSPNSLSHLNKTLHKINDFELNIIRAWHLEKTNVHPIEIFEAWEKNADALDVTFCHSAEDYKYFLALIGHHKLKQLDRLNHYEDKAIEELIQIIQHDPLDQPSYLRLISLYRQENNLKQARAYLEQALKKFPNAISVLTEAVETALASKAYKKAAQLADKILKIDPINTRVRNMLIDAHLSHARKLLNQSKHRLAENEISLAYNSSKTDHEKARIELVRGSLFIDIGEQSNATKIWQAATEMFGNELYGHYFLLLELSLQARDIKLFLKTAKIKPHFKQVTKEHLLMLFNRIKIDYKKNHDDNIYVSIQALKSTINSTVKFQYSVPEFNLICEITSYFSLENSTLKFTKQARKQHPEEICFSFYEIQAREQLNGHVSHKDMARLYELSDLAQNKNDTALIHKINMLINPMSTAHFMDDELDDEFDNVFDDTGPIIIPDNIDALIDDLLKIAPANELKKIGREFGESDLRVIAMQIIMQAIPEMTENNEFEDNPDFLMPPIKKKKAPVKKKSPSDCQLELF